MGWEKEILRLLDNAKKTIYLSSSLHVIAIAIAIKVEHLRCYASNVNHYARQANELLKSNSIEATEAIENSRPYSFKDDHILYSIIGQTEAFLIELKSVSDLTMRYARLFYRIMFGLRKRQSDIQRELKKDHVDLIWMSELDGVRNDFVHHYSPWIKFRKRGQAYDFVLALPDPLLEKLERKKTHANAYVDALKIREYVKKSEQYFNTIIFVLKKDILVRVE